MKVLTLTFLVLIDMRKDDDILLLALQISFSLQKLHGLAPKTKLDQDFGSLYQLLPTKHPDVSPFTYNVGPELDLHTKSCKLPLHFRPGEPR